MIHRLERKKRAVLRHPLMLAALLGSVLAVAFAISGSAVATTATCANTATLTGSAFEIDVDANLVVNTTGCIDWLAAGTNDLRTGVLSKPDKPTGSGDDSFGQGTSENDANPTIVNGSIPPNKSDLKKFGLYQEAGEVTTGNPSGKYLALFWARVQSPQGTTNMDFELNKLFCDPSANPTNCAINSKDPAVTPETPVRSVGDKLITYDLSKGGTVPTISIRTWSGTVWGAATVISGGANPAALGSVNTSAIAQTASDAVGPLDPFTFGEVSLTFGQLFGTSTCGKFGSAYLKSRSSDSFTAEIKDFIGPQSVNISNCTTLTTDSTDSVTLTNPISDTATLTGATATATGGITFKLYGPFTDSDPTTDTCVVGKLVTTLGPIAIGTPNASGDYVVGSGDYTPTAVGRYQWVASYGGDANNTPVSTACKDANEASVVTKGNSSIATSQVLVPNDSAQVTPSTATGTITFYLFKPSTGAGDVCSVDNIATAVYTKAVTPLVSGAASTDNADNTDTLAGSHALALGTWKWLVRYGGNGSLNGSDSVCTEAFTITEP